MTVAADQAPLGDRTTRAKITAPQHDRPVGSAVGPEIAAGRGEFHHIITASPVMLQTLERAAQLARYPVPVLILGETGVGKALLARAMHDTLDAAAPFVVFNCGAVSKTLIGAELFGHATGAYAGTTAAEPAGRYELADGGTLCLDEIGALPLDLQAVLLRAMEEGAIYRWGEVAPRRVAVRLIAMTNHDLRGDVAAGRFRRDLFYRLNLTGITLPPLRDREGDVELLIKHFNATVAACHGVMPRRFGAEVTAALGRYDWPGNVRELHNLIEVLLLVGETEDVGIEEIPEDIRSVEASTVNAATRLADIEYQMVQRAIETAGGNLTGAARQLGISRSTLYRRMGRHAPG
ncbi:MAG: sigma 54-interacting transcriptional regulator [Acidiphilium sp.]|nr:sigma 54-interacting transcriptional regulator [Acidiphilium sp.]MDD4936233.1 sigma 54-interacting transcriptional regulator [Acidiphilium sp.]